MKAQVYVKVWVGGTAPQGFTEPFRSPEGAEEYFVLCLYTLRLEGIRCHWQSINKYVNQFIFLCVYNQIIKHVEEIIENT